MHVNEEERRGQVGCQVEALADQATEAGINLVATQLLVLPQGMDLDDPLLEHYAFRLVAATSQVSGMWLVLPPQGPKIMNGPLDEALRVAQDSADHWEHAGVRWNHPRRKIASLQEKVALAKAQLDAAQQVLDFEQGEGLEFGQNQDAYPAWRTWRDQATVKQPAQETEPSERAKHFEQMSIFDLVESLLNATHPEPEQDPQAVDEPVDEWMPVDGFDRLLQAQYLWLCAEFDSLNAQANRLEETNTAKDSREWHSLNRQRIAIRTRIHRLKWLMGAEHVPMDSQFSGRSDAGDPDSALEQSVTM